MKIRIYQINPELDTNRLTFLPYSFLEKYQGTSEINSAIYHKVFEGKVNCTSLEDVFRMFNTEYSAGFKGWSLSVSDIVEVVSDGASTFHFCDSFGFVPIRFDPELAGSIF